MITSLTIFSEQRDQMKKQQNKSSSPFVNFGNVQPQTKRKDLCSNVPSVGDHLRVCCLWSNKSESESEPEYFMNLLGEHFLNK